MATGIPNGWDHGPVVTATQLSTELAGQVWLRRLAWKWAIVRYVESARPSRLRTRAVMRIRRLTPGGERSTSSSYSTSSGSTSSSTGPSSAPATTTPLVDDPMSFIGGLLSPDTSDSGRAH